ncbi:hypothetical protein [Microvirga roseola]|uniref:hypothetical protein n=1 Tax=Microvirga roseola TaxID=2883126 RepID=UPI001E5D0C60|nr:hypothetical protein [Microvirga roseola]
MNEDWVETVYDLDVLGADWTTALRQGPRSMPMFALAQTFVKLPIQSRGRKRFIPKPLENAEEAVRHSPIGSTDDFSCPRGDHQCPCDLLFRVLAGMAVAWSEKMKVRRKPLGSLLGKDCESRKHCLPFQGRSAKEEAQEGWAGGIKFDGGIQSPPGKRSRIEDFARRRWGQMAGSVVASGEIQENTTLKFRN